MSVKMPHYVNYHVPLDMQNFRTVMDGKISKIFDHLEKNHQKKICEKCQKFVETMLIAGRTPLTVKKGSDDLYGLASKLQNEAFVSYYWQKFNYVQHVLNNIILDPKTHPELYPSEEKKYLKNTNELTYR